MPRYMIVIDPSVTDVDKAARALAKAQIAVADKLEMLNTLIVEAGEKEVQNLKKAVPGITSIEEEGEVGAL